MSVLVIDVGSSSVRAAVVRSDGTVEHTHQRAQAPRRPSVGTAEFDAAELADVTLELAQAAARGGGEIEVVGIAAQRASTVLWERASGVPVGPAISWQDVRTAGQCLALRSRGFRLAPNQSATKLAYLLDRYDPGRARDLCFGTVESYLAFTLSYGATHVTDASNAALTGLVDDDVTDWDDRILGELRIPRSVLPEIVDSLGLVAEASAIDGSPPIGGLVGDQQASLIGQARLVAGEAKVTFGTGGMLDCLTDGRPTFAVRGEHGCFPVVAWRDAGQTAWGIEAVMLSAGSCVEWLISGLGLIGSAEESAVLAASVPDTGGVYFVPALGGIGAPLWDFGARGALLGISAATTRAEIVRAVLEGIAQRGADLVEAAETDSGIRIDTLCVDGGMIANPTFLQLLADATRRPIAPSAVREATMLGAAYLAGTAQGTWPSLEAAAKTARRGELVQPGGRLDRNRWLEMRDRALRTVPAMSALEF